MEATLSHEDSKRLLDDFGLEPDRGRQDARGRRLPWEAADRMARTAGPCPRQEGSTARRPGEPHMPSRSDKRLRPWIRECGVEFHFRGWHMLRVTNASVWDSGLRHGGRSGRSGETGSRGGPEGRGALASLGTQDSVAGRRGRRVETVLGGCSPG